MADPLQPRLARQVRAVARLDAAAADGRFRKNLLYRLKVVTIRVPALWDRAVDVPELAHHFLARLRGHPRPGNMRELQSAGK